MSETRSPDAGQEAPKPITRIATPLRLEFTVYAGREQSAFLRNLVGGRIVGRRSTNGKVYVPPVGACPMTGDLFVEDVVVAEVGTLTTYCVVNIPFEGQRLQPPYVCGWILLDGADVPLFHIVAGIAPHEVRMGMRLRAVWEPEAERELSLTAIRYFEPTGEADAPFESYEAHL